MKFLFDTNFLLIPANYKVDIFYELQEFGVVEPFIIQPILKELDRLVKKGGSDGKAAKLGLTLIEKKGIKIIKISHHAESTDDDLIEYAKKGYTVCTQDRKLIEKLKKEKLPVIFLRQKRKLVME